MIKPISAPSRTASDGRRRGRAQCRGHGARLPSWSDGTLSQGPVRNRARLRGALPRPATRPAEPTCRPRPRRQHHSVVRHRRNRGGKCHPGQADPRRSSQDPPNPQRAGTGWLPRRPGLSIPRVLETTQRWPVAASTQAALRAHYGRGRPVQRRGQSGRRSRTNW